MGGDRLAETKNFGVAREWFDAVRPYRDTIYFIEMANKRKAKQLEKGQKKKGKIEGILKSAKAQKQKGKNERALQLVVIRRAIGDACSRIDTVS